ncbi:MAG: hypothetical protein MR033_06330 [Clostridiales bacterium]|nr:hypothetical protein [Clostridiales bacterium]
MEFLMGAAGAAAALALFGAGVWAGRRWPEGHAAEPPEAAPPDPALTERLQAEQAAFESMLSYNQDTAYGLGGGELR